MPPLPIKMTLVSRVLSVLTMKRPKKKLFALRGLSRDIWQTFGEARFPIAILE